MSRRIFRLGNDMVQEGKRIRSLVLGYEHGSKRSFHELSVILE